MALSIFPGRCQPSIVDRNELNYRVRNGNGWTLILISTNSMSSGTARKQTILYCPSRLLSRLFQVFHLYPHRETSVSVSRRKRKSSGGIELLRSHGSERSAACPAFSRPARAANQRSVCSAIGENRLVRHLITLAERDVCLRGYFELVTRTGFEPMLTA